MLKPFLRRSQQIQWKENHTVATLWKPIHSGLDRFFFRFPSKESRFPFFGISILAGKQSSRSITERSCATGIDFFKSTSVQFPAKTLKSSMQQISLVWMLQKVLQIRHGLTPFSTSEREAVKTNASWNPVTFSSKQQQPAEVLHLKRESDEKSVHLQVLQILHILCFTDVNSETEIHFFLVKFKNSRSEDMNQNRQVFEFLIQGALRELISHDSLSNLVQSQ